MPVGIRVSSEEMGRQSVTMGRQPVLAVVKKLISKKIHITNYNNTNFTLLHGKRRCFSLSISLLQCFSLSISLVSLYFSVYQLTTVNRRNEDLEDLQVLRHLYSAYFGIAPTMKFLSLLGPVIDPSTRKNVCLGYKEHYLNYKYLENAAAEAKAKELSASAPASVASPSRLPSAEEHHAFAVILDAVDPRLVETLTHLLLSQREDHIDPRLYAAYTLVRKGNKKVLAVGKVQVIDDLPSRVDETDDNVSRTLKRLTKRSTTNYNVDWKAFEGLIVALHRIGFFCCTGQKKGLILGKPCEKPRDGWKRYELTFTTAQQSRFAIILIIEYLKKRWGTGSLDETSTAPMPSKKRKRVVPEVPEEATHCLPVPTLLRAASELHHSWPQEFGMGLLHWLSPTKQEPRRASTQDSDSNLEDNIDDIIELFGSRSPGSSLHTSPPSRLLDSSHFNISPFTFSPFRRVSTFSAVSESGETLTFKQKCLQFVLPSSSKRQKLETLRHAPSSSSSSSSSSSCLSTRNEV